MSLTVIPSNIVPLTYLISAPDASLQEKISQLTIPSGSEIYGTWVMCSLFYSCWKERSDKIWWQVFLGGQGGLGVWEWNFWYLSRMLTFWFMMKGAFWQNLAASFFGGWLQNESVIIQHTAYDFSIQLYNLYPDQISEYYKYILCDLYF